MTRRSDPARLLSPHTIEAPINLFRNILAAIAGLVACMMTNGCLIALGPTVIPPPEGVNVQDLESLRANIHLFEPKHFLFPLLAHAMGSLVGGSVAAAIAATRKMTFALVIGSVHLLGGIAMAFLIPAPVWFVILDLGVAYLPAAWLGAKITASLAGSRPSQRLA